MTTLSIVTIVLNDIEGVQRTSSSVLRSRPNWVEWVVIDGGSNDGTIEFLEGIDDQIDCLVSEADKGIADAFNKGISHANGNYVLFLNAGDMLDNKFYRIIESQFDCFSLPNPPVIVGKVRLKNRLVGKPIKFCSQKFRNRLPHQAMVIRRDLFDSLGMFREDFSLGMDYEWSLRLKDIWSEIRFVDRVFAIMEPGGVSMSKYKETYQAYHQARMEHGMARIPSVISSVCFTLKVGVGNTFRNLVCQMRGKSRW